MTIDANVTANSGATISPGLTETINGSLHMYAGSTFASTLNAGSANELFVDGTNGSNGSVNLDTSGPGVTLTGTTVAVPSNTVTFLSYSSASSGIFANASQGSTVNVGGSNYIVSYVGGIYTLTPTLALSGDLSSVTVTEGESASNTGVFQDFLTSPSVTISASFGSVIQVGSGASGTWSWSSPSDLDDTQSQTVIITATDTVNQTMGDL